jgi:hypothetical protein
MSSKWAVSTDLLETGSGTEDPDTANREESAAILRWHALWNSWEQLSGGGPIKTNPGHTASPALRLEDRDQASDLTIRSIYQERKDKKTSPRKASGGKTAKGNRYSPYLASMSSLRSLLARQNRAKLKPAQENSTRDSEPREPRS